jgi:hypothetical protein
MEKEILFNWFEGLITKSFETLEGKPLNYGKLDYYKQEFFKQYFTHFLSIKALLPGLKIQYKGRENEITSLASVMVLIRACLENFAIFHYIYRDSSDFQEIYFRFWSWFREGLMHKQQLSINHFPDEMMKNENEIKRIWNDLRGHKSCQSFSSKEKDKYVKKGKWCF